MVRQVRLTEQEAAAAGLGTPGRRQTAPALPAMTEKALQQAVTDLARLLSWEVYHTHDSRHSAAGFPDCVLARFDEQEGRTRLIVAELKSERGVVTAAQQRWLDLFKGAGIPAYVFRPQQWHSGEIERVLAG